VNQEAGMVFCLFEGNSKEACELVQVMKRWISEKIARKWIISPSVAALSKYPH
jgi:hypothetical protein